MAENVGGSEIEITASSGQAEATFRQFFAFVERERRRFQSQFEKQKSPFQKYRDDFDGFTKDSEKFKTRFKRNFRDLPDHLKPFHEEISKTRREFREMDRQAGKSLGEMADAATKAATSFENMTSATSSGKQAIKVVDGISQSVRETQLAIMGLNKEGTVRISTEETNKRLEDFRTEVTNARKDLEKLRDAGDFASYEAGMEVLEQKLADVDQAFQATARGGETYNRMLDDLGVVTSNRANQMAIAMEAQKDSFLRNVKQMEGAATQTSKLLKILPETSSIQAVDRFFLGITDGLEKVAARGSAASIAVQMLGENASMKDLQDRIKIINAGLGRMSQVALVAAVAVAGFTAAMFNAAKGPSPADVLAKQAEALAEYDQALKDRTNEIASTWALFEQVTLEKTNPRQLYLNLEQQLKVMTQWRANLASLSAKVPADLAKYLAEMGPAAAAEIDALNQMSAPGLQNYVRMWREYHGQAKEQAISELEGLKQATDQKVAELQQSLTPLGISIEEFKQTWSDGVTPFVESWGYFASKVVDAATAIGQLVQQINNLNPAITAAAGNFAYLFTVFSLILAPLAIGIGRAKGFQASLAFVIKTFKPLIIGFGRIAGMASVLSAVIVILVGTFMRLWQHSENFRNALGRLGAVLRDIGSTAAAPLIAAFKTIASEFVNLINQMVGSKGQSMASFWQKAGDLIAVAIDKITAAFKYIQPVVSVVFGFMATFIVQTFRSIVAVITSGVAIIQNIIGLFKNVLAGNWSAAWDNVKAILKNAVIFIWNFIQVSFAGRIIGLFRAFGKQGLAIFRASFTSIRAFIVGILTGIRDFFIRIFTGINNAVVRTTTGLYNGVLSILRSLWGGIRGVLTAIFNFFKSIFTSIHSFVSGRVELTRRVLTGTFRLIFTTIWNILKSLLGIITSIFRSMWTTISTSATNIRKSISSAWAAIKKNTTSFFDDIWKTVSGTFTKIVDGAKGLPKRIGDGIKKFGGYAVAGAADLSNKVADTLQKGVNGLIGGINWVLGKIGVDKENYLPTWKAPKITIPRYKDGTDNHRGGPALLNDGPGANFREIFRTADGNFGMFKERNVIANLPPGTSVLRGDLSAMFMKGMPRYKSGTKDQGDILKELWDGAIENVSGLAKGAKDLVKAGAGQVKDLALDVWSFIDDPASLMKKVYSNYIPQLNLPGGALADMVSQGMKSMKDKALSFVSDKLLSVFGGGNFGSDKNPLQIGAGSGYGGMMKYVEYWYNMVKDRFGPTNFMGGYNNRNVRGGSSKSMHAYGRAFDIGGSSGTMAKIAEFLRQAQNIQYVIYNRRISGKGGGWRAYNGVNPHTDHVHADFLPTSMPALGGAGAPNVSGGAAAWRPIILQAAARMRETLSAAELNGIIAQIDRESDGNQRIFQSSAVNDINMRNGNPARGLLQYIPSTFRSYMVSGHTNILSGMDQLLAFFNNLNWRRDLPYGRRGWGPTGPRKYAKGGFFMNGAETGIFGEAGPEMALPLVGRFMYPYAEAVATNLANIFGGMRAPAAGIGSDGRPLVAELHVNGRKMAEATFKDVTDLQNRERGKNNRGAGRVDV